jgi:exosortase
VDTYQPNPGKSIHHTAYLGLGIVFIIAFFPAIRQLVELWANSEDYSHGFLIIPVSIYFVWRKKSKIKKTAIAPGSFGVILFTLSIALYLFGFFANIDTLISFSFVLTILAIVWCLFGKEIILLLLFPLLFLFCMVPVPAQLYSMATNPLQLLVSMLSATIVDLLGTPILREGNLLHLPGRTLAVVQACSGLRSLTALVTICAVIGYLSLTSNFFRFLIVISSVPIAIVVNIFRVTVILVALHYFSIDLTKGHLHTLLGLTIFALAIVSVALLRGILIKWDVKPTGE